VYSAPMTKELHHPSRISASVSFRDINTPPH
jgi:hypothetical protein